MNTSEHKLYSRGLQVILAIVLVAAVSGYFIGLRQTATSSADAVQETVPHSSPQAAEQGSVLAAVDYRGIGAIRSQQRQVTTTPVSALPIPTYEAPDTEPAASPTLDLDAIEGVMAARARRRAFDGAPPTVPHTTNQMDSAACLSCHEQGRVIGPLTAPRMCHEMYVSCNQCHVEQIANWPGADPAEAAAIAPNSFVGVAATAPGPRAFTGAPPVVPHPLWMRTDCLSCHGPAGARPMQTTHPWRQACTQCHVSPASGLEGAPLAAAAE